MIDRPTYPPSESDDGGQRRFIWLLISVLVLLLSYPYTGGSTRGAFVGGAVSLLLLTTGVFAVRHHRITFVIAIALGVSCAAGTVFSFVRDVHGLAVVEGCYSAFYGFTTVAVLTDVIRSPRVTRDTIYGAVCGFLLIGITFGTFFDFLESVRPGSFSMNVDMATGAGSLGWRELIFFSFMTLTTVGYGDITPATAQAQSFAIVEGSIGVLYVAVLVARIVGAYSRQR